MSGERSMGMAMMQVGPVGMPMYHGLVAVDVGVLAFRRRNVGMTVMPVVMPVLMLVRGPDMLMGMRMPVPEQ